MTPHEYDKSLENTLDALMRELHSIEEASRQDVDQNRSRRLRRSVNGLVQDIITNNIGTGNYRYGMERCISRANALIVQYPRQEVNS